MSIHHASKSGYEILPQNRDFNPCICDGIEK